MTSPQIFRKRLRALLKQARHEDSECPQCGPHSSGFLSIHPGYRFKCVECDHVFEMCNPADLPFIDDRLLIEAAQEYDRFKSKKDWASEQERHKAELNWEKRWKLILAWEEERGKDST